MVWDLRAALLKKGETESARLADFAFRLRARTMKRLAPHLDPALPPADLVALVALHDDEAILARLALRYPDRPADAIRRAFDTCRAEARAQLIGEVGDPTPHRLA